MGKRKAGPLDDGKGQNVEQGKGSKARAKSSAMASGSNKGQNVEQGQNIKDFLQKPRPACLHAMAAMAATGTVAVKQEACDVEASSCFASSSSDSGGHGSFASSSSNRGGQGS